MRTLKSYLFKRKEIVIRIPKIIFSTSWGYSLNMWYILGWMVTAAFATIVAIILFACAISWSVAIHKHYTTPQPPKTAKQEFVGSCTSGSYDHVANVGPSDPRDWTCKKK